VLGYDVIAAATPFLPGTFTVKTILRGVFGKGDDVAKNISLSKGKYGEAAQHIEDAQKAGHPNVLEINRGGASGNRADSLQGIPKVPGKQLDEYPPAMFKEGGAGASVRPINPADNMGAGACIGNSCRGLPDGSKVNINVTE
jgi:filamentous hemagglutinin